MPDPTPSRQLGLFPGVAGPRPEEGPLGGPADEPTGDAPAAPADDRQLDLFADRVVLARDLDAALAAGRFEDVARLRHAMDDAFGPTATSRGLAPLDGLDEVAWHGPPAAALSAWAAIDRGLAGPPPLRDRVRSGVFARLLRSHRPGELLAAMPNCLPALAHALAFGPGRSLAEGRLEARALVRDALLAGRALDGLDFREDEALADLLAEDLPPRWLACLGRIRRLWPASPATETEWEALAAVARSDGADEEPATAFWRCLRLAESPACPDELRQEARRRMKQLHPELHAQFMRRAAPG